MNYTQAVSGLYSSYTHPFQKGYSKIRRATEYTLSNAHFHNTPPIEIPYYGALIPSVNFAKKWKKIGKMKWEGPSRPKKSIRNDDAKSGEYN
jgi:hypothetical protein